MLIEGFSKEQINSAIQTISRTNHISPLPKTSAKTGILYVFRHGQSYDNEQFLFSGWRDPSLTELGISQAEILADKLKSESFDLCITSTLTRARETLEVVLKSNLYWSKDQVSTAESKAVVKASQENIKTAYPEKASTSKTFLSLLNSEKIILDDRIIERSYGNLQGSSKIELYLRDNELEEKYRRAYDFPAENGESLKMVEVRVKMFLDDLLPFIREKRFNVVLSCHSNSMRAIRRFMETLSIEEMCMLENPLGQDYASYEIR